MEDLLEGWRGQDSATVQVGSAWALKGRSLALRVPSVAIAGDWHVLLNPRPAEFAQVRVVGHGPFQYDKRMFV